MLGFKIFSSHLTVHTGSSTWQEPHFHGGLIEHYLVLAGKIGFVKLSGDLDNPYGVEYGVMSFEDGPFTFLPDDEHNILITPGAEFVTVQLYDPSRNRAPNPGRKGEDWWPASEDFDALTTQCRNEVTKMF